MKTTNKDLYVCHLTAEQRKKTCGYWFTVTNRGGTPHTAFETRESLELWATERGLTLPAIPNQGDHGWIIGEYRQESHLHDADSFESIPGDRSRTLSNGDYVVAIISRGEDGIRTVHTLNPNVRTRQVFDYFESRAMVG